MDRNRINSGRVVAVVGFVFLLTATIISILLDGDPNSIIEKIAPTAIVIPIVHGICLILTIVCIIKPSPFIMVSILLLESELTILTNYEELGIFFFYAALILILCKDMNKSFVDYVIQDYTKPMGVSTYKTSKDMSEKLRKALPDVEDLKKLLDAENETATSGTCV